MKEFVLDARYIIDSEGGGGICRFATEVMRQIVKMQDVHVLVALPQNAPQPSIEGDNLEFIRIGKEASTRWEQYSLVRFCKKRKLPLLCPANNGTVLYPAYVVIHDVRFVDLDQPVTPWLKKIRLLVRAFIYRSKRILTVSNDSKERILKHYPKLKQPPVPVFCGYEHVNEWREEPVENVPEEFYFAAGTATPFKNSEYMIALAKNNPQKYFIISGGGALIEKYREELKENKIENCRFTGPISDGQMLWLYRRAKGVVSPSLYEGFGIPPLEAVACGCRRIFLSDIPVYREIYGDCAVFFDPKDYENTVSLNSEPMREETAQKLLETYSWKRTAELILETIFAE